MTVCVSMVSPIAIASSDSADKLQLPNTFLVSSGKVSAVPRVYSVSVKCMGTILVSPLLFRRKNGWTLS